MSSEPTPQPSPAPAPSESPTTEGSLLEQIIREGRLAHGREEEDDAKAWLRTLVDKAMKNQIVYSTDAEMALQKRIAAIDETISTQLNEVMHAKEFQRMESTWRGLHYLLSKTETSDTLKIKVLNINKTELLNDLKKASEFDQSEMFKKIHDEGYGVLGGDPYGALIGDYEFGNGNSDMEVLEGMSRVAAAAHAPFIAAASPSMFNWDSFTELGGPRDLATIFSKDSFIRWKAFRDSDDSKYVGLCLPHVLMRLPYGKENVQVEAFDFEEKVDGKDHSKYLWGNAAFALGARLTDAFAKYGWCTAIRGVEGGGLVEDLPAHTFQTDDGDVALKCPTEIAITDRRENELSNLGFIPLCHYKGKNVAAFVGTRSCQKPQKFMTADATANAELTSQLQYTMAVARFAHFLKAIVRDKLGSFTSRNECEQFLNQWISNYVVSNPDAVGFDIKAAHPLAAASVSVQEIDGKPGSYRAVAHLQPHFQLDALTVSLRLVARLPLKA